MNPTHKAVSVISSDHDEGVFELANLLQVLQSRSQGVVQLEQVTKRSVNILHVHFFIDELEVSWMKLASSLRPLPT